MYKPLPNDSPPIVFFGVSWHHNYGEHRRRHNNGGRGMAIIDLYSGCGGLSLGAKLAGFHTITAVDIDSDLQSAFSLNFPNTHTVTADVRELTNAFWEYELAGRRVDGVIGGPPCQGFSRMGKREVGDPRNTLVGEFFRQVMLIRPRFFVMENVEGLLDDDFRDVLFEGLEVVAKRYQVVGPMMVNAADFGVPTERKRVLVLGYDPQEMDPIDEQDIAAGHASSRTIVADAICDIPEPTSVGEKGDDRFGWAKYRNTRGVLSLYAERCRSAPPADIGAPLARAMLEAGFVSGLVATAHSSEVRNRFAATPQRGVEPVSRYPKLAWNSLCPTLRAGTGKDRGSFQSVRPIHPESPRVISVREAARLQGFPDWFLFHPTKWHSFRMIGNSVSPLMSEAIFKVISSRLTTALVA